MSLLNWKSEPEKVTETLRRILFVEGEELVKFLQDIFDALDKQEKGTYEWVVEHVTSDFIVLAKAFVIKIRYR